MDQGLFTKHIRNVQERDSQKQKIITLLFEKTGVTLTESELVLSKKTISITTSSVKRSVLLKNDIHTILQSNGFTFTF